VGLITTAHHGIECVYPNAMVSSLKGSSWEMIGNIIGENGFVSLLLNTSLFLPSANVFVNITIGMLLSIIWHYCWRIQD
jgi:hypothetical protein